MKSQRKRRQELPQLLTLHPLDTMELMTMMFTTTFSATTPSQSLMQQESQLDKKFFTRVEPRKPLPRSSSLPNRSLKLKWKPTWPNSSQEPGLNLMSTPAVKSTSLSHTPSWDLFWEDSTNSFLPQAPSLISRYENSLREVFAIEDVKWVFLQKIFVFKKKLKNN